MINVGGYLEYRGGCSVPWGDIMSTMGGYLEYRGGVQYRGGYHDARGGYHDARGGIMSTVEGVQYCGEKIFCHLSTPRYS